MVYNGLKHFAVRSTSTSGNEVNCTNDETIWMCFCRVQRQKQFDVLSVQGPARARIL